MMSPIFVHAVDEKARELLASRPEGIAMNGSTLDAKGENGFRAVTPSEIARVLSERFGRCNHLTVGDALEATGWCRFYGARKSFYFLDHRERDRMSTAYYAKKAAQTNGELRVREERRAKEALLGTLGGSVTLYVKYPTRGWRGGRGYTRGRPFVVPAISWLEAAARYAAKARSIEAVFSGSTAPLDTFHGSMEWKRPPR
jgi:hypothetical protein